MLSRQKVEFNFRFAIASNIILPRIIYYHKNHHAIRYPDYFSMNLAVSIARIYLLQIVTPAILAVGFSIIISIVLTVMIRLALQLPVACMQYVSQSKH